MNHKHDSCDSDKWREMRGTYKLSIPLKSSKHWRHSQNVNQSDFTLFQSLSLHTSKWFHYTLFSLCLFSYYTITCLKYIHCIYFHAELKNRDTKWTVCFFTIFSIVFAKSEEVDVKSEEENESLDLRLLFNGSRDSYIAFPLHSPSSIVIKTYTSLLVNDYGKEWNKCACLHCFKFDAKGVLLRHQVFSVSPWVSCDSHDVSCVYVYSRRILWLLFDWKGIVNRK